MYFYFIRLEFRSAYEMIQLYSARVLIISKVCAGQRQFIQTITYPCSVYNPLECYTKMLIVLLYTIPCVGVYKLFPLSLNSMGPRIHGINYVNPIWKVFEA